MLTTQKLLLQFVSSSVCCPVVDCEWENWSVWSDCTKSCDGGTQTRTRGKIPAQHGGAECEGASEQTRDCNTDNCPGNLMSKYALYIYFTYTLSMVMVVAVCVSVCLLPL